MTQEDLLSTLRSLIKEQLPLPGLGESAQRHQRLYEVGRRNLSLARLAEAHWDAVAILAEGGREAEREVLYGVWASERPGGELTLEEREGIFRLNGAKKFCSGAGLIDRALVTVGIPEPRLIEIDLRRNAEQISFEGSDWKTSAFRATNTATAIFRDVPVSQDDWIGPPGWYIDRPGFWHGACGPAACWAGGAAGLIDYAKNQSRDDPHTLAHLGAMHASVWALQAYLERAAREIDNNRGNYEKACIRALAVRHLVEQACTDVLCRLARAYGPHPMAMDECISRRYQELDLYLRQCHAERDLEVLGRAVMKESRDRDS